MKRRTWNDYSPCEICLINPPWITKGDNIWHGIKATMPPLSLLSIASYLEEKGREVVIIDAHAEKMSTSDLKKRISRLCPRIVGITVMTATTVQSNLIARLIKEADPSTVVVMGGVHAEVLPDECLRNKAVDIVVRGEGEFTFHNLCEAVLKGKNYKDIHGISYRDAENGKFMVAHSPNAEAIKDLNQLPMLSYHLVPMHLYYPAIGAYKKLPAINMLMTRGCPGKCSFCNSAKTILRTRDAGLVVDEIIKIKERYGIREIQFYDDTFTATRANVLEFCRLMKEKKVGISWSAFARIDCINEQLIKAMKEAGCHQIMFGIESGDLEVLKKMGKTIPLQRAENAIKITRAAGIEVRCTFIYGCEGETAESMQKTLDFALKLDPDIALFNIATPYPGTQLFNWAKRNGYLMHEDWTRYELGLPVIRLPTASPEKIMEFYKRSFIIFYRRPIAILRRVKNISTLSHLVDAISAFTFVIFRYKLGPRGIVREDWNLYKKEHFFDYPLFKS